MNTDEELVKQENTNWSQSVAGVVLHENQVLLVRHTYGVRKDRLIVPGGYALIEESAEDAVRREVMEETGISVEPEGVIGVRFNHRDWYVAFRARYVSGEPRSDHDENSEALWMPVEEALASEEIPDLTRKLIACAASGRLMERIDYDGTTKYGSYSFYGVGE